jgi:transcriptional antiterminator NusG
MEKTYWYVAKVFAGKERQLCDQFNEMIENGKMENIKRFVCPLEKEYTLVRKKKVIRDKVIYNGYIYIETFEKLTNDELKHIGLYENMTSMYGKREPIRLPKSDVDRIIKDDTLEKHVEMKLEQFKIGDTVMISAGPFKDFTGVIKEVLNDKVNLEVKVFERMTNVTLDVEQINNL